VIALRAIPADGSARAFYDILVDATLMRRSFAVPLAFLAAALPLAGCFVPLESSEDVNETLNESVMETPGSDRVDSPDQNVSGVITLP